MSYYDENDNFDRAFIKDFADLFENEIGIISDNSQDVEFIYRDDFDELMENVAEHILYNSDKESLRLFDIAKERLEDYYSDDDEPYSYDDKFPDIRGY